MRKRLEGKVIVISGGTKGVGKTAAEEFAREGAKIVIGGRDEDSARISLRTIKAYGSEGIFVYTNLENVEDCKKLFDEAVNQYGRVDGFFNYAGITSVSPLDSCNEETFNNIMNVNFRACFFCCQAAVNQMRKNGGGSIVLTGSPHAWFGEEDRTVYACSKGALLTLSEYIAHYCSKDHIRCNYLTLGWTPTEGEVELRKRQGMNELELRKMAGEQIPMGRMLERTDYVGALIFMMSDESSMMTGSNFRITGGWYV